MALASAVLNLVERKNYAPSLLSHKVWGQCMGTYMWDALFWEGGIIKYRIQACAGAACFLLWASALRYLEV